MTATVPTVPAPPGEGGDDAALEGFLEQVAARLGGLSPWRRRRVLADLRGHLLELVEAEREAQPTASTASILAGLAPEEWARGILRAESLGFLQRGVSSLAASLALGLLSVLFMRASGRSPVHALAFGAGYGLSVGFTLFWFQDRWRGGRGWARWALPMALGALASVPWAFMLNRRFDPPMVFYGAVTGYLLLRFAASRRWSVWVTDNLALTAVAFLLAGYEFHWDPRHIAPRMIPWAMGYHLTLQGGVALALWAHRRIGRWFLELPVSG